MALQVSQADVEKLVELLGTQAATAAPNVGVGGYFRNLVRRANLPEAFKRERLGGWTNHPDFDARELVTWAVARDLNPADRRYTTLGSLLEPVLAESGWESATTIVAVIFSYQLIRDERVLDRLAMKYQVPVPDASSPGDDYGPDIDWRGPEQDVELQGLFRPAPTLLDAGFMKRAMEQTRAVCRVEVHGKARGTGVLIDEDLVLTNFHVLGEDEAQVRASADQTVFRFGVFTERSGDESKGQTIAAESDGVVELSSAKEYDFALVRASETIYRSADVAPVSFALDAPLEGDGLNILQHPRGNALKLALSSSGVASLLEERGLLQYFSQTATGSSGSPCFNDDWNMVALHHSVRSRMTGVRGQGTVMSAIHARIKSHLNRGPA